MTSNAFKRIASFFMAVLMVLGTVPAYVLAENGIPYGFSFQEFTPLGVSVREQSVALGTSRGDLELPGTLKVVYAGEGSKTTVSIPVKEWESDPDYKANEPGVYIFSPVIEDEVSWDLPLGLSGIDYPEIEVTVREAPVEGTASRTLTVEVPDPFPEEEPDGTPNGDALATSNPLAKKLWDILEDLLYDDEAAHLVELAEHERPQVDLGADYSDLDLENALDTLTDEFILDRIAQPAADAFWADFPARYWLKEEMELLLSYSVDGDLLTLESVAFSFGYYELIMPTAIGDVELWVTIGNVPTPQGVFGTIKEAIDELEAKFEPNISNAEIRLMKTQNYPWSSTTVKQYCAIVAGEGATPTIAFDHRADLKFEDGVMFKDIVFSNSDYIDIQTYKLGNTSFGNTTFENVSMDFATSYFIRINGNASSPLLELTDTHNIVEISGFQTVKVTNKNTVGGNKFQTGTLSMTPGSELIYAPRTFTPMQITQIEGMRGTITYAPTDTITAPASQMIFLEFTTTLGNDEQYIANGITLAYDSTHSVHPASRLDYLIQMPTGVQLDGDSINNISLSPYDPIYGLRYDENRSCYYVERGRLRVMAMDGTIIRRSDVYPSFHEAVDRVEQLYVNNNAYSFIINLREDITDETNDLDFTLPSIGSTLTIKTEQAASNNPLSLGLSNTAFTARSDIQFANVDLYGVSLTADGHNLTFGTDPSPSNDPTRGVTFTGDILGGGNGGTLTVNYTSSFASATGLDKVTISEGAESVQVTGAGGLSADVLLVSSSGATEDTSLSFTDINVGELFVGDNATLTSAAGTVTVTQGASVGNAEITASSIAVGGTLTLASSTLTVTDRVEAGTMDTTAGATIKYDGTALPLTGNILILTQDADHTLGGTLILDLPAPQDNMPAAQERIIRVPKHRRITDANQKIQFANPAYSEYSLTYDNTETSASYYRLGIIVVYLHYNDQEVPYTSFDEAVYDLDTNIKQIGTEIRLAKDIPASDNSGLPETASIITTRPGESDTYTLNFNGDLSLKGSKTEFHTIDLDIFGVIDVSVGGTVASHLILGKDVELVTGNTITGVTGSTLTFAEGAEISNIDAIDTIGTIILEEDANITVGSPMTNISGADISVEGGASLTVSGDIAGFNSLTVDGTVSATDIHTFDSLTVGANASVTANEIQDFDTLTMNGGKLQLSRLYGYQTLDVSADSGIELSALSPTFPAPIEWPQTGVTGNSVITVTVDSGHTLAAGQYVFQSAIANATKMEDIRRSFSLDIPGYVLIEGKPDTTHDYFVLSQIVDAIELQLDKGPNDYVYGNKVTATITLKSGTDTVIRNETGAVRLTASWISNYIYVDVINGIASYEFQDILDADTGNGYTVEAEYTDYYAGISTTPLTNTATFQVKPRELGVVPNKNAINFTKRYDSTKNVVDYDSSNLSSYLSLNPADLVDQSHDVKIDKATFAYDDPNFGTGKSIVISGIVLDGDDSKNYTVNPADQTVTNTKAKIEKAQLGMKIVVEKVYDGTVTVSGVQITEVSFAAIDMDGLYGSDAITYDPADLAAKMHFWSIHVGSALYPDVTILNVPLGGADNYELSDVDLSGEITPRPIDVSVTATTISKEFDGNTDAPRDTIQVTDDILSGDPVAVVIQSADYEQSDAGTGLDVTVVLRLDIQDAAYDDDYTLDSLEHILGGNGEITQADANSVSDITIRIPLDTPQMEQQEYDLSAVLAEAFAGKIADSTASFSVDGPITPANNFFSYLTGNDRGIVYMLSSTPNNATATANMRIVSTNYKDVSFKINFIIMELTEVEILAEVADRDYNGRHDSPLSNIRMLEPGGTPANLDVHDLVITFTGADVSYYDSTPPKNAGTYRVTLQVPEDTSIHYYGGATFTFTIRPVNLRIAPVNKAIEVGDAIPLWDTLDDFTFDTFVQGENWNSLFPALPTPQAQVPVSGIASEPGTHTVTLPDYLDPDGNYIIQTGAGALEITQKGIETGWLVFDPAAPDGDNGWYVSPIQVSSSSLVYTQVGMNGFSYPTLTINSQTTGDRTVELYLMNPVSGQTTERSSFTYKMDLTAPRLLDSGFAQNMNEARGVLTVSILEEHSGLSSVQAVSPSGSVIEMQASTARSTGLRYSCQVEESGVYTIRMSDNAGHQGTATVPVDILTVFDIEIRQNGKPVSYIYTDVGTGTTLEAVVTQGAAVPGVDFNFAWSSSNASVASVSQSGRVTPHAMGRTVITVEAMGVTRQVTVDVATVLPPSPIDPPTDPGGPGVVIPPGIVPPGVDYEDLRIIIEPLDETTTARMQAAILANNATRVERFLNNNSDWRTNTQWMRIRLVDAANDYRDVPVQGTITIYLPYPAGTNANYSFMLMHMPLDTAHYTEYSKTQSGSVRFTVEELGPFSLSWKNPSGGSGNGGGSSGGSGGGRYGYGSYTGGGGSIAQLSSDFWTRVIRVINQAQPGNRVVARPFAYIQTCPATVLHALAGKDLTLVIHWTGETIVIYGLDLIPPGENVFMYTLEELAELYGISRFQTPPASLEELHNPVTGGDDIVLLGTDSQVILTESGPLPLPSAMLPTASARPVLADSPTGTPLFATALLSEDGDQQSKSHITIVTFSGVLLAAIIGWGILRRNDFRPVDEVVTIPGDAATATTTAVPVPVILLDPIGEQADEIPDQPEEEPVMAAQPEPLDAVEAAAPAAPVPRPQPMAAIVREAAKAMTSDESFFHIIDGHKKLQQLLLDGQISRQEYEKKKRILVMYS